MLLEGRLIRDGRWWLAEVPLLDAMTQGRTRKEAVAMAADLVMTLVDGDGFSAEPVGATSERFVLSVSCVAAVIALCLRRRREAAGLSLTEVAERLGAKSRNGYARYEQGRTVPTITKLAELLHAIDPGHDLALTVG